MGRTNDIFIPTGNDWVVMGKAHMNIWEGPFIHFTPIGKDQGVMGKTHIHVWKGPLILFTPTGKDQVGWERPTYIYGKDH
jgi:hypothetical protein